MKVLVCGGRDFVDVPFIQKTLDKYLQEFGFDVLIEGDARGVDRIAGYWARKHKLTNLKYPADWEMHGKAAGYIRNRQMLEEGQPDLVIAFPGGKGTANMIKIAKDAGVNVIEV